MGMRTVGRLAGGAVNPRRRQGRFRPRWRPSDPVKYFLTEHRRAHCELFASATALILRSAGVPTRYVTGVICNERHPSGKYYIARYGNAHAWVEAFDRQNKRWVVVDTTPPSITTPAARPDSWQEQLSSRGDYLRLAWFEVLSSLRRGHFAEGTMAALALVWEWLLYLVTHPVWGTLGGFVFGFLIWILLYRRKRRLSDHLTPERRKIQAAEEAPEAESDSEGGGSDRRRAAGHRRPPPDHAAAAADRADQLPERVPGPEIFDPRLIAGPPLIFRIGGGSVPVVSKVDFFVRSFVDN